MPIYVIREAMTSATTLEEIKVGRHFELGFPYHDTTVERLHPPLRVFSDTLFLNTGGDLYTPPTIRVSTDNQELADICRHLYSAVIPNGKESVQSYSITQSPCNKIVAQ